MLNHSFVALPASPPVNVPVMQPRWFDDRDNVQTLAELLVGEFEITTCAQLLWFYSHPWRYSTEWEIFSGVAAGTHGRCRECEEITKDRNGDQWQCPDCTEQLAEVTF